MAPTDSLSASLDVFAENARRMRQAQGEYMAEAAAPSTYTPSQSITAAGLGLLPILAGALFKGREGAYTGAQAGLAGLGSFYQLNEEEANRNRQLASANARIAGEQANQYGDFRDDLLKTSLTEGLKQQNRLEREGVRANNREASKVQSPLETALAAALQSGQAKALKSSVDGSTPEFTEEELQAMAASKPAEKYFIADLIRQTRSKESQEKGKEQASDLYGFERKPDASKYPDPKNLRTANTLALKTRDLDETLLNLKIAVMNNDAEAQRALASSAVAKRKELANAGASYTGSEQKLYGSALPAFINGSNSWAEYFTQKSLGIDPLKLTDSLRKEMKRSALVQVDSLGWRPTKENNYFSDVRLQTQYGDAGGPKGAVSSAPLWNKKKNKYEEVWLDAKGNPLGLK